MQLERLNRSRLSIPLQTTDKIVTSYHSADHVCKNENQVKRVVNKFRGIAMITWWGHGTPPRQGRDAGTMFPGRWLP